MSPNLAPSCCCLVWGLTSEVNRRDPEIDRRDPEIDRRDRKEHKGVLALNFCISYAFLAFFAVIEVLCGVALDGAVHGGQQGLKLLHEAIESIEIELLLAVAEGLGGIGMDLNEQAVSAHCHCPATERPD